MTSTHNQGPDIVTGYVPTSGGNNPEAGPSATYQCDSVINPMWPVQPGLTGTGHVKAWFNHPYPTLVDGVPKAISFTQVCPALAATTAVGVSAQVFPINATVASGRAVGVPVVPFGVPFNAANAVNCLVLDPGYGTGNMTAGSAVVSAVPDTRLIIPANLGGRAMWVAIVGAGGSANTNLIGRVISRTYNSITLDTVAGSSVTGGAIIILDPTGVSAFPYVSCGAVAEFDLYSSLSRAVSVNAGSGDGGFNVIVSGYDVYLQPMTELIVSAALSAVNGKKAFKYISGVTVSRGAGNATITTSLSVGTTDIFGLSIRSEAWEYMQVFFSGTYVSVNTGWTAGLAVGAVSTNVTADVRGTYVLQSPSNGTNRLAMFMSIPLKQIVGATYADYSALVGQAQA